MYTIADIAKILFHGFRPYVHHTKRLEYDTVFSERKTFTKKFVLEFFPKYVNQNVWMSKPKEKRDSYLFNYYFIEIPTVGIKYTPLLKRYVTDIHPRLKKVK